MAPFRSVFRSLFNLTEHEPYFRTEIKLWKSSTFKSLNSWWFFHFQRRTIEVWIRTSRTPSYSSCWLRMHPNRELKPPTCTLHHHSTASEPFVLSLFTSSFYISKSWFIFSFASSNKLQVEKSLLVSPSMAQNSQSDCHAFTNSLET